MTAQKTTRPTLLAQRAAFMAATAAAMSLSTVAGASEDSTAVVRSALSTELERAINELKIEGLGRPHYIAYTVYEHETKSARGSFGSLVSENLDRRRTLRVSLRVGDDVLDSGNFVGSFDSLSAIVATLPLDDDVLVLRRAIWLATDRAFKRAAELLEKKRAAREGKPLPDDYTGEFTKEERFEFQEKTPARSPGDIELKALVRDGSAAFRSHRYLQRGVVTANATRARRIFVASDGSSVRDSAEFFTIEITGSTQADDGMPLRDFARIAASSFDEIPEPAAVVAAANQVASRLDEFRQAPRADDYAGPVLLTSVAAGQLLKQVLLPQLTGAPSPEFEDSRAARYFGTGSEWTSKVGRFVLPKNFSVIDDPSATHIDGLPLYAAYNVDEEGIKGHAVDLVKRGKLKGFVMSRQPRKGFEQSTGHGRGGAAAIPRAHTSNVIVTVTNGKTERALQKKLLSLAKNEGLEQALIIERFAEGASTGGRRHGGMGGGQGPIAAVAWLVDKQGKRTAIRGLELGEVQASRLKDIVAAGRERVVYSGVAQTRLGGSVRSSVVTAALLFKELEAKRPGETAARPPVLERPQL